MEDPIELVYNTSSYVFKFWLIQASLWPKKVIKNYTVASY